MPCTISIIAAMSKNKVIGRNGEIPWHLREDLKRFKEITRRHAVIMGRKTAESIFSRNQKALPERFNIVVTRKKDFWLPGFQFAHSWEDVLDSLETETEAFVIGGAEIYSLALPHAQRLYLTEVQTETEGDTLFPEINLSEWKLIGKPEFTEKDGENDFDSTYSVLERRGV